MSSVARGRQRRSHGASSPENHERWLLTYADLITLLMVFFVVMYSMSLTDANKFRQVKVALERAFNVDVLRGTDAKSVGGDAEGSTTTVAQAIFAAPESLQLTGIRLASQVQAVVLGTGNAPTIAVISDAEGVLVRMSGSFLFDSGRAELKPNVLPVLDVVAAELRTLPNDVRVDGHTDNVPVNSPRYPTNWELSSARALAVIRYLAESGGVPASRLIAAGYGEFRPLAPNDTREQRSLNRRVEIRVLASSNFAGLGPRSWVAEPPSESAVALAPRVSTNDPSITTTTELP